MPQQGGGPNNMAGSPGGPSDPSTFNLGPPPVGHGPSGSGPSFNPGPSRMGQKMMPPPPSPSLNGQKDQSGGPGNAGPNNQNGKNQNQGQGGGNNPTNSDGSPRNQPPNAVNNAGQTPNAGGTGPPTPAPGSQQNQQHQQNQGPGPGQNMAPSPSSLLGGPPSLGSDPLTSNIFSTDFIQSVASSLDEFDPGIFRPDGDINFERDFGQWFNQDAMVGGSLDQMK